MTTECGSCGAPTGDGAALCTGCTGHLAQALTLAASIAPDLDDAVARQMARGDGGKRSKAEAPLPFDVGASAVSARFTATLRYWTRELKGQAAGAEHMANWLHGNVKSARQHQDAARMLREVKRAVSEAEAVIDVKPGRVYAGPCPGCGADLLGEAAASVIQCGCGYVAEVRERKSQLLAQLEDHLGTVQWCVTAAAACGIRTTESAVYMWAKRKQLVPHGHRPSLKGSEDVPLFRLGDVAKLAIDGPGKRNNVALLAPGDLVSHHYVKLNEVALVKAGATGMYGGGDDDHVQGDSRHRQRRRRREPVHPRLRADLPLAADRRRGRRRAD